MSKDPAPALDRGQLILQKTSSEAVATADFHEPRCDDDDDVRITVAGDSTTSDDDDDDDDGHSPDDNNRTMYLQSLPNEILLHILGFLDVNDLLSTSRTSHLFRSLSLSPVLHLYRRRRSRALLPPLLANPGRPSLAELMARSIFLTHTSIVSRRLARSLVSIRLSRRLAARPSAEALVERAVLPKECVPGMCPVLVSPAIVARRKAIEKEKVKDGLRRWIASKWTGEVREREEDVRKSEESHGVGRVWRLTRFWERIGGGDRLTAR
ncbi:hypothetical protein CDD80_6945 [Ophiocordyceps camponoti-rufipedis]|uniref:F-box domain-containing protein n=1 Tax=Ophiocordyceps camponoti-rufipedis TaxID=2004952 RepID=A0A2C5YJX9_9HYPO|nr:hypothetical protein CDD80_6945 [Ophiocordyceps camponoti-rufipedis]